jgi:hypothetical protein
VAESFFARDTSLCVAGFEEKEPRRQGNAGDEGESRRWQATINLHKQNYQGQITKFPETDQEESAQDPD